MFILEKYKPTCCQIGWHKLVQRKYNLQVSPNWRNDEIWETNKIYFSYLEKIINDYVTL